jgi:hypothetical protein
MPRCTRAAARRAIPETLDAWLGRLTVRVAVSEPRVTDDWLTPEVQRAAALAAVRRSAMTVEECRRTTR